MRLPDRGWSVSIRGFSVTVYLLMHLATIAITWRVWFPDYREFPIISPIFENVPPVILTVISPMLIALLCMALVPYRAARRYGLIGVIVCMILVGACEQLVWQPYWYLAVLIYLNTIFNVSKKHFEAVLLVLMASVYVFSGLHKINPISATMFHFLFLDFLPSQSGYLAGVFECLLGVMLLFDRSRSVACAMLVMMHVMILLWLGPLELYGRWYNYVVWPWNIAQVLILIRLGRGQMTDGWISSKRAMSVAVTVFSLQALSFIGYWPNYFSYNLYSYTTPFMVLELKPDEGLALPYVSYRKEKNFLSFHKWAMREMEIAAYPEKSYLERLCATVQKLHGGECRYYEHVYDYNREKAKDSGK